MGKEAAYMGPLVSLARSNTGKSGGVPREPLAHLGNAPVPRERVGVAAVVLRPGRGDVADEVLARPPRAPLEVVQLEAVQQQLGLVQPGRPGRGRAHPPPAAV